MNCNYRLSPSTGMACFNAILTSWMVSITLHKIQLIHRGLSATLSRPAHLVPIAWYHSHTGVQRSDGLVGALIVRERPNVENLIRQTLPTALQQYQDIPAEHTVVIADWFHGYAIDEFMFFKVVLCCIAHQALMITLNIFELDQTEEKLGIYHSILH